MTQYAWFGLVATLLIFISQGIEIATIFRPDPATKRSTEPSRSTFWLWSVALGFMAASYAMGGETAAVGVTVAYGLTVLIIAVLSLRYGWQREKKLPRTDVNCILGAVGLIIVFSLVWWVTGNRMVVLVLSLAVDFMGAIPTIRKVWLDPDSESRLAWAITVPACALNFFAVHSWSWDSYLYQPYMLAINSIIAYGIWRRRLWATASRLLKR